MNVTIISLYLTLYIATCIYLNVSSQDAAMNQPDEVNMKHNEAYGQFERRATSELVQMDANSAYGEVQQPSQLPSTLHSMQQDETYTLIP